MVNPLVTLTFPVVTLKFPLVTLKFAVTLKFLLLSFLSILVTKFRW